MAENSAYPQGYRPETACIPTSLPQKKYDTGTDLMRVLAALGVITIHCSDTSTFSGILFNSAARFSVPVFVIISGYYMLARKPDGGQLARKCVRLFALMLFWSAVYYGTDLLQGVLTFDGLGAALTYLLTEPVHLWYICAAITLYLFTPPLCVFTEYAGPQEYRYALALTFFFGSPVVILARSGWVPVLNTILDRMKVPYLLGMMFLYLLGGYLRRYGLERPGLRKTLYGLGLLGTAATVAGTHWLQAKGYTADLLLSFFAPGVIAQGAAVFVFCQYFLFSHPVRSEKLRAALHFLARDTLGIYLAHPLVITFLQSVPMPTSAGLTALLRSLLVFAVSAAAVSVLRIIPVLRCAVS